MCGAFRRVNTIMEPVTVIGGGVLLTVAIGDLAEVGVLSVIALLLIFGLVQAGLSVFQTRALNNQVQQGIQAIVGVNNMSTIDRAMEDDRNRGNEAQIVNNGVGDGRGGSDEQQNGRQ